MIRIAPLFLSHFTPWPDTQHCLSTSHLKLLSDSKLELSSAMVYFNCYIERHRISYDFIKSVTMWLTVCYYQFYVMTRIATDTILMNTETRKQRKWISRWRARAKKKRKWSWSWSGIRDREWRLKFGDVKFNINDYTIMNSDTYPARMRVGKVFGLLQNCVHILL